ncbi:MAG: hypothetical protein J0L75_19620 [Spirochaetes bacterium]|nr:hypothetical protein [Spirochaetota bacterium]
MDHAPIRRFLHWRFLGNALACLAALLAPVWGAWLESATPLIGPALLQARATNRQVILRVRTGEASARTVAFFMRRDAPFSEMSDLTNAFLVDRVRTSGGSTTFIPDENGTYYAAALIYASADASRQTYHLLISGEAVEVDWVPPKMPLIPFVAPQPIPVETPRETNVAPAKLAETNQKPAAAPSVNVAVQWPTNLFLPFLAAMNPPQVPNDKQNLSAKEFLAALTNLLAERKAAEAPRPLRDRYFNQDPDPADLEELSTCSRELRDLYGALARHRREALPVTEAEVYPLLLTYANAVVRLEQCLVRIMQRGIKLQEAERLQGDFADVNRELLELWRRLDARLKEGVLGN